MMYENENVPEPTCEGNWWASSPKWSAPCIIRYFIVQATGARLIEFIGIAERHDFEPWRKDEAVSFTGPIPEPSDVEDKRTKEAAQKNIMGTARAAFSVPKGKPAPRVLSAGRRHAIELKTEVIYKPAPSEDDVTRAAKLEEEREKVGGERWGKLLHGLRSKIARKGDCTFPWKTLTKARRKMWIDTALRFRAKCVAPYEELKEVVRSILAVIPADWFRRETCLSIPVSAGEMRALRRAFDALSISAPDEPPKPPVSDEDVGSLALDLVNDDLGECVEVTLPARRLLTLGAAIRAKLEGKP